jgi:hypothetical protein
MPVIARGFSISSFESHLILKVTLSASVPLFLQLQWYEVTPQREPHPDEQVLFADKSFQIIDERDNFQTLLFAFCRIRG